MTRAYKNGMAILIIALFMVMEGCVTASPHEIFKDALYGRHPWPPRIGQDIDMPAIAFPNPKALINTNQLSNGNLEMEYRWLRSCRYFYEVDPKTRKIVGARFEGNEDDCVWIP